MPDIRQPAQLWTDRRTGESLETTTLLTTEANDFMKTLHDRMPVVLTPDAAGRWLAGDSSLLADVSAGRLGFRAWPVSRRVNNAVHEGADLIGKTMLVTVGHKGKYTGVVGVYPGAEKKLRYELVDLDERREPVRALRAGERRRNHRFWLDPGWLGVLRDDPGWRRRLDRDRRRAVCGRQHVMRRVAVGALGRLERADARRLAVVDEVLHAAAGFSTKSYSTR